MASFFYTKCLKKTQTNDVRIGCFPTLLKNTDIRKESRDQVFPFPIGK